MTLDQLYCKLAAGPLVGLAMADSGTTISAKGRPKVAAAVNECLNNLYTLFTLKEKEVLIELQADITFYHLRTQYSQQGYDPVVGVPAYILDLGREKFQEDILQYRAVFDKDGRPVPLNDQARMDSVFTPQDKILQVPNPEAGNVLSVMYQAQHPLIHCDDTDATIELPQVLEPALLNYIGYYIYSGMTTEGSMVKAQGMLTMFQSIVQMVKDQNAVNESVAPTNERFKLNGWI